MRPSYITVAIPSLAIYANSLDDPTLSPEQNPLIREGCERLPDRRTNRYRLTVEAASDLLALVEGCPALSGDFGADDGGRETRACWTLVERLQGALGEITREEQQAPREGSPQTRHTPGPWVSRRLKARGTVIERDNGRLVRPEVATVAERYERDANARLIAAAPELLEALRGLDDACLLGCPHRSKRSKEYGRQGQDCGKCSRCIARAAIAKATEVQP